uniref:NPC1 middle luminal domain-containing protein n=1 Tax=Megaselia scalaris TaxID=36166 RepID=T1H0W5_MEGSC
MPDSTVDADEEEQTGVFERLGAKTEQCLEAFFTRWGTFFATYPWYTLLAGTIFLVLAGLGIKYLHITTNPVELWASPQSRARVEREYFDSTFQPFYRIEQIIIKAVDLPEIVHPTADGPVTFGPVFNKSFLIEVLNLQQKILEIGAKEGSGIEKICYAPLSSEGVETTAENCVVQSLWGYFENDVERLDDSDEENGFNVTYLDQFHRCFSNPYLCLAPYGGPIDPAIALGGFLKTGEQLGANTKYEKANALIL